MLSKDDLVVGLVAVQTVVGQTSHWFGVGFVALCGPLVTGYVGAVFSLRYVSVTPAG